MAKIIVDSTYCDFGGLSTVIKHLQGQHDQSTHGNWAEHDKNWSTISWAKEFQPIAGWKPHNDKSMFWTFETTIHDVKIVASFKSYWVENPTNKDTGTKYSSKVQKEIENVLSQINDLAEHAPLPKNTTVRVFFGNSALATAPTASGNPVPESAKGLHRSGWDTSENKMETQIYLRSAGFFDKPDEKKFARYMPSYQSVDYEGQYILAHEWGHARQMNINSINTGASSAMTIPLWNRVVDGKYGLSEYGQNNSHEGFAEAFADWFLSKGKSDNQATQTYAYDSQWRFDQQTMGQRDVFKNKTNNEDNIVYTVEDICDFEVNTNNLIKHLQGQHDQSTHGNWAKTETNFRHVFGVNDLVIENADVHTSEINGSTFATFFDNKDNITEDQKRDVLALVHDLQTIAPMSPMSEVKIIVSNNPAYYDGEFERGWTVNYSQPEQMVSRFDETVGRTVREMKKPAIHKVIIAVRSEDMNHYADEDIARQSWMPSANAKQFFAMEYFLAHEWGHATNYDALFHKGGDGTMSGSGYKNEQTTGLMLMAHEDQLSPYGQTNTAEGYAEAFAEWFMTDGKSGIPIVKALAKEDNWGMQYKWKK